MSDPNTHVTVKLLCVCTETKLKEYPVAEKEVLKILTQVNVARRECEIVRMLLFHHFFLTVIDILKSSKILRRLLCLELFTSTHEIMAVLLND